MKTEDCGTPGVAPGRVRLRAGSFEVELAPALGGSVAAARLAGVDVLRPLSARAESGHDVLGVACFPMVPYANRIVNNAFDFDGRRYRFEPNVPPEPFNEHGNGWTSAWTVEEAAEARAVLGLERLDAAEPYVYRARQEFTVWPDRLRIRTSVTNAAAVRMPFGFGQHPWFPRDADTTLRFNATHFWLEAPGGAASDRITMPPELSFARARQLPRTWRNNCYGGWQGSFELRYPSRGVAVTVEADPVFRHLMLYADPALPVFCVEPQTNATCAFNKLDEFDPRELGVLVLGPGESATGVITLAVSRI
jgi:aldose 1-epimerase